MAVNYKILFEVRLLHEYYLTDKDGKTIFDLPVQQDRLEFLAERFRSDYPSINDDLAYELPESDKSMAALKLRVIEAYSGFRVFTPVSEQVLTGGIRAYKPSFAIPVDFPILIQLRKKSSSLDAISNSGIRQDLPARYYFTNRNLDESQVFPLLSRALPALDNTQRYEQGELTRGGDSSIQAFFYEKDGTGSWMPVNTAIPLNEAGYISRNDRSLLPTDFNYTFDKEDNVRDATFVLKDGSNATVSNIRRRSDSALGRVSLNYSAVVPHTLSAAKTGAVQPYTLEVTGDNEYRQTHAIMFCEPGLLKPDTWGLVHLQPQVADSGLHLIDNDGLLITRKAADGSIVPAPIFEIRIKSRFAFWRYINNKSEPILDNPALHPFMDYDASKGLFETRKMINASYTPVEFSGAGMYFPNPGRGNFLRSDAQRTYADVIVSKSETFDT